MELSLACNQAQIVISLTQQRNNESPHKNKDPINLQNQKESLNALHQDYRACNYKIVDRYSFESNLIHCLSSNM